MHPMNPQAAISGLLSSQRNRFLHPEFEPQWEAPAAGPAFPVPQGDTRFDPFLGTSWGQFLDAAGASEPMGARMGGQFGNRAIGANSAMQGLQSAMQMPSPMNRQGMRISKSRMDRSHESNY